MNAIIKSNARILLQGSWATTNKSLPVVIDSERYGIFTVTLPNGLVAKVDYKDLIVSS